MGIEINVIFKDGKLVKSEFDKKKYIQNVNEEGRIEQLKKSIKLNDNVCPDYDEDCDTMTEIEANWCFMGCQGHPCNPNKNNTLGTAKGYCPIIHKSN